MRRSTVLSALLVASSASAFGVHAARAQTTPAAPAASASANIAAPTASASSIPVTVEAAPATEKATEPFAYGDFTWLNGSTRQTKALLDSPIFTGSFLLDVNYTYSFNRPIDDTVVGSTALSRNNEMTIAFVGFGGDFHYENARGRLLTQFGLRSTVVPRNDSSTNRGQFDLQNALRYLSEAYGGYHWDKMHGINLDVGIFMSYVGLFSYDNFENWAYQPSYTSDNTPWFFNGARVQVFPTDRLKLELWVINGWQTYGKFNELPGLGYQILWRPEEWFSILSNGYVGWDTQDAPGRTRYHSDNSMLVRYLNKPGNFLDRAAMSFTFDVGFENGAGVTPFGGQSGSSDPNAALPTCTDANPCAQNFVSGMGYHRMWFDNNHWGWTFGGGFIHNPGRYLVLGPTGQAANTFPVSTPGTVFDGWDASTTIDYMPDQFQTWRLEFVHRETNVPYFAGHGGVTSPDGYVTTAVPPGWKPDLVKSESRIIGALLLRF
ncbi:MAG: outer membrane beta-barrel protein [Polyangiales bacterium]